MSGTAASAAAAPGFRLLYLSSVYLHLGGLQVITPTGWTAFNAPYTGNNRTINLSWALPLDTVEYGDTGLLNKNLEPANDLRAYGLMFDLLQTDATDAGAIMLENVLIQVGPRPADVTAAKTWGGSGTAFDDATNGWNVNISSPDPANLPNGAGVVAAANMTANVAGTNNGGFASFFPKTAAGLPSQTTGKTLRTTYVVSSSNASQTPGFRFLTLPTTAGGIGVVFWGDQFAFDTVKSAAYASASESPNGIPGSPKTGAGSTVEVYAPGQNAGSGAETAFLTPQFDMLQGSVAPANGWARPAGVLTVTSVKMELVNP
jgi:hypothetical protein